MRRSPTSGPTRGDLTSVPADARVPRVSGVAAVTARPWQVVSHPPHRWPRVVRTYASREKAQAEAERNNAIIAAHPEATFLQGYRYTVQKRKP